MQSILSFDNLTLGYDRHPAIHHLDTQIGSGSLTAIVGPNGAGKSTLLKGVVGALKPIEGQVALNGLKRKEIAYLPQQSDIDRSFPITVFDLVAMGLWHHIGSFLSLRSSHRTKVMRAVASVGLTGLESRPIGSLSGGQMQRAQFARLILQDARLVLLDEPFTAIDSKTVKDLLEIVKGWNTEGRTVLAVLHDAETVREYFPTTMLVARELVAHGITAEVLTAENQFKARQMCEACASIPHVCSKAQA